MGRSAPTFPVRCSRVRNWAACIVRVTTDGLTSKTGNPWPVLLAGPSPEWALMSGTAKSTPTGTSKASYEDDRFRSGPACHHHRRDRGLRDDHRCDATLALHGDYGGIPWR